MLGRNKMQTKIRYTAIAAALISLPFALQAAERKLLMSGFKDIIIENDMAVQLTTRKSPKAIATGDKRELSKVKLTRRGDVLVVQLREFSNGNFRKPVKEPLTLQLSNHDLENVTVRGNGVFSADNLRNSDNAQILVIGNGSLDIGNIQADELLLTVSGNAKVTLGGGKVRKGTIRIQGSGIVDSSAVAFRNLDVTHQGNGQTSASASDAVRIANNGRGSITITGKANCFIQRAGFATIDCPKYGK